MVAAFEGWNDAADAATGAVDTLLEWWDADVYAELDAEEFYDFQQVRPIVHSGESGHREILWPTPTIFVVSDPAKDRDVLLVRASEPNFRWSTFCANLVALAQAAGAREIFTLGALLADAPHTRPVPITATTNDPMIMERMSLPMSRYSGPIGITTVLTETASQAGLATASLWAAVPHYVAEPPCPKATLALIGALEDATGVSLPHGPLKELSEAWQRGVEELSREDPELGEYIESLEEDRDASDLPEASGDAIAREFERYLRRRENDTD